MIGPRAARMGGPIAPQLSALIESRSSEPVASVFRAILSAGFDALPLPGSGATLERWQALAAVACADLSLVKLYEAHTDALAILAELETQADVEPGAAWAVWAAEIPGRPLRARVEQGKRLRLDGIKAWCSGAGEVDHALVTVSLADGEPSCLARLALHQPGVSIDRTNWQGVGMRDAAPVDVHCRDAVAFQVGSPGDYVHRPGFWHGGAGIAACWYGGARALVDALHRDVRKRGDTGPYRTAGLGELIEAMAGPAALLCEAARWIDDNPQADAQSIALKTRLSVERMVQRVLDRTGRALGAAPFCRDGHFARAAADLPVFVRQSHAERDERALGQWALAQTRVADLVPIPPASDARSSG